MRTDKQPGFISPSAPTFLAGFVISSHHLPSKYRHFFILLRLSFLLFFSFTSIIPFTSLTSLLSHPVSVKNNTFSSDQFPIQHNCTSSYTYPSACLQQFRILLTSSSVSFSPLYIFILCLTSLPTITFLMKLSLPVSSQNLHLLNGSFNSLYFFQPHTLPTQPFSNFHILLTFYSDCSFTFISRFPFAYIHSTTPTLPSFYIQIRSFYLPSTIPFL